MTFGMNYEYKVLFEITYFPRSASIFRTNPVTPVLSRAILQIFISFFVKEFDLYK